MKAPYSGLLVYVKDRRGEKPSVGNTVFPGSPIAERSQGTSTADVDQVEGTNYCTLKRDRVEREIIG